MSSTQRELRPNIVREPAHGSRNLETQLDLLRSRFVFSPLLSIDTRFDQCGHNEISSGVITEIANFIYQQPNPDKINLGPDATDVPMMRMEQRPAGVIANGLVRNYARMGGAETGFCILEELTGLSPQANTQDAALIFDLQLALLPHAFEDGRDQLEFLATREAIAAQKGQVYVATLQRLINATARSVEFAEMHADTLAGELAQRASGAIGYQKQAWPEDARICAWAGLETPQIKNPLKNRESQAAPAFDLQAFGEMLAASNAETLKAVAGLIGNALEAKTTEAPAKPEVTPSTPKKKV